MTIKQSYESEIHKLPDALFMIRQHDVRTMRVASLAVAFLLLGTIVLVIASLLTFAMTLFSDLAAIGTFVLLFLAVLAASALGTWADKGQKTSYW